MSIEKFEVGKKYRFLKDGDGDKMYHGVDAKAGQEFTVSIIVGDSVTTRDVTYQGNECWEPDGWVVYNRNNTHSITTLDDFEEVIESLGRDLDIKYTLIPSDVEESTSKDLIQQMITLQQEHNLTLMFYSDEVVVEFGEDDTEYNISSQKELTTLIEASNVLKSFERK